MIISVKQTKKHKYVCNNILKRNMNNGTHLEKYIITTVYLLGIPIFRFRKLVSSEL